MFFWDRLTRVVADKKLKNSCAVVQITDTQYQRFTFDSSSPIYENQEKLADLSKDESRSIQLFFHLLDNYLRNIKYRVRQ